MASRILLDRHALCVVLSIGVTENKVYLCQLCHRQLGARGYAPHTPAGERKSNVASFYLGEPYKETWQEFRSICVREGTSASKRLVAYIVDYIEKHGDGNPQTLLVHAGKPRTQPRYKTCKSSSRELHNGQFYCYFTSFWRVAKACEQCKTYGEK